MDQKTEYPPQQVQSPQPMQPVHQPPQQQQQMQIQQHQQQQQQPAQHQPAHHASVQAQPAGGRDPRGKDWQFSLFDCFGDGEASLIACFLPCMLHGRTMDRINDPSLQSHDPLNHECLLWGGIQCFTGCGCLYNMIKRTEIRERYGIQGSGGSDYCISYCCLCCALVQQDREVALRAGHYAPVTQGYQGQKEGMQMPGAAVHQQSFPPQQQQPQQQPQQPQHQQSFHQQSPSPQQQLYQSPPGQQMYQQSPPPQQAYQTPPPQQMYQQQPMQTGVQSTHEQQMPTYPHDGQYGQKQ
ncbi:hypothetical protein QQS21_007304 [Conoideocrella luteorostrata]|uniref:PLAC8 family protein n=1 Tax=Conoideocrella luteorostrata TaxID=1105319 RepID=A0AAJ0CNU9_9HYPO|nr:hypothetical protein QQS21_007304 [Conoideocrella luteorostrata]